MRTLMLLVALAAIGDAGESGTIRITTNDTILNFSPDGKKQSEAAIAKVELDHHWSPDRKQSVFVKQGTVYIADKSGGEARQISPNGLRAASPMWSPDGKMLAFVAKHDDHWQLYTVDKNGTGLKQLTESPSGIDQAQYSPQGYLSFLRATVDQGKFQRADLVLLDKGEQKVLVKDVFISAYAWSPNGETLAYGKLHSLVFLDWESGKSKEVTLAEISDQLFHHAPTSLAWNPTGTAVACRMPAHVGRAATFAGEPDRKIFGDDEVFVVPREGKAHWFVVGDMRTRIEWIK